MDLLLRLIIAHLLTDFVIQPKSWVKDRAERKGKSTKLYLHVCVTTVTAYLFSGLYDNWIIPLVIFTSHLLIDYLKSKTRDKFSYFIADQMAHLLVILVLWLAIEGKWETVLTTINTIADNTKLWAIVTGYLFVSWPLGIIIGKATQRWRDQISREKERIITTQHTNEQQAENADSAGLTSPSNTEEQELGLANAGKWIGICERILILTFVLMGQFTAIGFLMTAKSILRFSEKEANTQLKTEYVLVGTLVSFASSAMIGVLMNFILNTGI